MASAPALAVAAALLALGGCASAPPVEEMPSAENYYRRGLEVLEGRRVLFLLHDVDYGAATELFQEVIDNYPYSEYATLAELKIADVHFDQGNFEQAASYYQDFVELHPSHPEVPYAIYRHGLCSFEDLRSPDLDQEPTRNAVAQFSALVERYPDSEYAPVAREMLSQAIDRLAEHEIHVGNFYFERRDCGAAANRFRNALVDYPDHSARLGTLERLASALACARQEGEAIALFARVLAENPDPETRERVLEQLEELGVTYPGAD